MTAKKAAKKAAKPRTGYPGPRIHFGLKAVKKVARKAAKKAAKK